MKYKNIMYLPSGRIFLLETNNNYTIECTEMRDVSVNGKDHLEVRETNNPHTIWKHLVPYSKKWLLTVSTQLGCVHKCKFCDVANLPFEGNLTYEEICEQIGIILDNSPHVTESDKVKIGFARMGEPAWNIENVLQAIKSLPAISASKERNFKWLPCFNTILPRRVGAECINKVLETKDYFNGFLHFQISCNSTNEGQRKDLFGGADVLSLEEIISQINQQRIVNRTVTLNFIVMKNIEVSVAKLNKMGLNKEKFTIKLIPMNNTLNSQNNKLETYANYSNYEKLLELKDKFEKNKIPVVVDAIAKCEEAGLCCGQLAQIFQ